MFIFNFVLIYLTSRKTNTNPMKNKGKKPAKNKIPPTIELSKKKLFLYKTIAILLPFVLLVLIEGGLRLFGYGHNLNLFIENPENHDFWVMNSHASEKYFTDSRNATTGFFESFQKKKTPNTFRIFVLGESTTTGFPYLHNGSFHRWLKYRLMQTFPETNFEIINVSLVAVNSYTVLGFGQEIIDYKPDVVMIYTGHNEYYGALGIGSTSNVGNNPLAIKLFLKLKNFRLVQLLNRMISSMRKSAPEKNAKSDRNLMIKMAADQHIVYQSDKYEKGIRQFESNMSELCELLSKRKIPVFLSNLVSNEKDLKPFVSSKGDAETSADDQFKQAELAYTKGDFKLAKTLYVKAKDLDLLRFRAPEAINSVIDRITKKYPGVYKVDTKTLFEEHSLHGILGKETLTEHVHPNLLGYALLSEAFYQALKQQNIIDHDLKNEMSFQQLLKQMPITEVDSLKGYYLVTYMKEDWTFNEKIPAGFKVGNSFEEKLAYDYLANKFSWNQAMDSLMVHYTTANNWQKALRVAEAEMLEQSYYVPFYLSAANINQKLNNFEQTIFYLKKAFQLQPDSVVANNLIVSLINHDLPEEAIPYLEYMSQRNLLNNAYTSVKNTAEKIVQLKTALQTDSNNTKILNSIAYLYMRMNNYETTTKYLNKALVVDHENKTSLDILKKLNANLAKTQP